MSEVSIFSCLYYYYINFKIFLGYFWRTFRRDVFRFDYAENTERISDKTTKISYSNLKDYIRSTVDSKIEVLLAKQGDDELVTEERYHITGELIKLPFILKLLNCFIFFGVNTSFI